MSVFARIQAALLGAIVFVNFTQVGVAIGEGRNERRAALNAVVSNLMGFVAEAHGADFLAPVHADLLSDQAFEDKLDGDDDSAEYDDAETPADFGATMLGLGLAGEDDDPYAASETALSDGIVGFYDDITDRLYVRGTSITAYTRLVLVHELTHAWQDQHYDLDEVEDIDESDAWTAAHALVEGDAMRIESTYRRTLSAADRAFVERIEGGGGSDDMSRAEVSLAVMYDFPYAAGEKFATTLYQRGGNDAIATAFADPPTTTEQVLHPGKYLAGEVGDKVPEPPVTEGNRVDQGELGELGLLMLAMRGEWDRAALHDVAGWNGDRYVTVEAEDTVCTLAYVRMDSPAARDRLVKALQRKALARDRITANGPAGADLKYCGAA